MAIEFISASTSYEMVAATLEFARPSGADTGDVLIAVVASNANNSSFSPPSGWNIRYDDVWRVGRRYWCIWRAIENIGTEPSTYTFAKSTNNTAFSVATLCFRGVNPSNPFAVTTDGAIAAGLVTSFTIPGVTTSVGGAMLVSTAIRAGAGSIAPGSMTLAAAVETEAPFVHSAYELLPAAGSTGTRTWGKASGLVQSGGYMTALRPDGEIPEPSARPWSRAYIVE